jgi:hypothetical protein
MATLWAICDRLSGKRKTGIPIAIYLTGKPFMRAIRFVLRKGSGDMMVDQISGNPSAGPTVRNADGGGKDKFNRVLSNKNSKIAEDSKALEGRLKISAGVGSQQLSSAKPVKIGTITSKNPTVSDLLVRNSALKKECWNIIFARQNRDKAYTRIPDGTDIFYNPATRELMWGDMMEKMEQKHTVATVSPEVRTLQGETSPTPEKPVKEVSYSAAAGSAPGAEKMKESLVDAVRPMIGKTYSDMNCYELLINGLSRMGVRYFGREGLGREMIEGAMNRGLPMNAYLNGEGLIRFSGSETYRKSFLNVSDPVGQARDVLKEMAAHLEKGSILSFSTESRGHTGIVSDKDGDWTFINSGVMDNPVGEVATSKGVGEENLHKEIENWFRLAARKNESLVITLGKLNHKKLAAYGAGGKSVVL